MKILKPSIGLTEMKEKMKEKRPDAESEDTRFARYLNSTMDEVSDPEMWMGIHHYSSDSNSEGLDEGPERPSGSTGH